MIMVCVVCLPVAGKVLLCTGAVIHKTLGTGRVYGIKNPLRLFGLRGIQNGCDYAYSFGMELIPYMTFVTFQALEASQYVGHALL